MRLILTILLVFAPLLQAGEPGSRVQYVGGTVAGDKKCDARLEVQAADTAVLHLKKDSIEIPYAEVTTLEYGLHVSRRYVEAALISPLFLLGKKQSHFLTIGYRDGSGHQQAVVLEVGKADIRSLLVSLEARTGRRIEFQDEEARKAGKG